MKRYNGNFVQCLEEIKNAGQEVATASEGIIARIKQGANSNYRGKGCWHPEGTARIGGTNYWCLQQFAPTTHYPQETLEANKNKKYLPLTNDIKLGKKPASQLIREIAERDAELPISKRRVLIPENQQTFLVPSCDLGKIDIAIFLARNQELAEKYGYFLDRICGIKEIRFYQFEDCYDYVAAGFWLRWLVRGDVSGFGGGRGFDYSDGSLFGVAKRGALSQKKIVEGDSKKIFAPTLKQVLKYSKPFVPEVAKEDFEKGLASLFKQ